MKFRFNTALLLGSTSIFAIAAQAQTPNPTDNVTTQRRDARGLEEIVVTAQKRPTNVMRTPVAITALSGVALKQKNVVNLNTLASVTPSLTVNSQGPTSAVNIRGIGLSVSSPNVASGVPIYRDSLFQSPLLSAEPFYDIGDVEVLRGPQGTLVGTNSTGGAVFVNSRSPEIGKGADGFLQVQGGSYRDFGLQGASNIPISDQFAARIAFNTESRASFWSQGRSAQVPNPTTSDTAAGDINAKDVRVGVLYQPNADFSVLVKEAIQADDYGGLAHTPEPGLPPSYGYPTQPFVLSYAPGSSYWHDFQARTSVEAKYKLPDGITIRSVSGFTYTHETYSDEAYTNIGPTRALSTPFMNHIEDHVWTQEFNILSPAADRLHWVAGSYSQFWPAAIELHPATPGPVHVSNRTDKIANSIFGEVGYNITPALEAHVGIRYTFDHAYQQGNTFLALLSGSRVIANNDQGQTDSFSTGRVGLDYRLSPDQFLYAVAAKGGKTGGINAPAPVFAPEAVYDYEFGVKSTWLSGMLRTQLGAFYMDYKRLQLQTSQPEAGTTVRGSIANAGSSRVDGVEAAAQTKIGDFSVDANFAVVDSSVSAGNLLDTYLYQLKGLSPIGLQCAPGQTVGCFNYTPYYRSVTGAPNPFSPRFTGYIGAQYTFELSPLDTLTPRADFSYTSTQYATVFQNPVDRFSTRKLLNLSLTYAHGPWTFVAFGTNVTSQYYIVGQIDNQNLFGNPAEYGFRLIRGF